MEISKKFLDKHSDFFIDFIKGLKDVYKEAWSDIAQKVDRELVNGAYPYTRRVYIDQFLKKLAKQHGLDATIKKNKSKNTSYLLIKPDNYVLTASAVEYPNEIVRSALYRNSLAEHNEKSLFRKLPKVLGDAFYILLLHGQNNDDPSRVGFIYSALPDKNCKKYHDRINLEDYYKVKLYDTTESEIIEDTAIVKFKPKIKEKEA